MECRSIELLVLVLGEYRVNPGKMKISDHYVKHMCASSLSCNLGESIMSS